MGQVSVKINVAYKPAAQSKCRYRILDGGAGSGKSHFMAQETLLNMLNDGRHNYLIVRKTGKSIKNSVFRLLSSLITKYGMTQYFEINKSDMSIHCSTGARIITSGLDDVEKLKSVDGINRIWVEEATEITERDFEQLDMRMRGINNIGYQITLTFNPISELHWIKKRFFDIGEPDAMILRTTYKDNKYLDEAYKQKLERMVDRDYQYYRIYTLGEWGSLGNLIFKNWEKADLSELIEVSDGKQTKQVRIRDTFDNFYNGLDFGFAEDPLAFTRLHIDEKRKIIYITDEIYEYEMQNDEAAVEIMKLAKREIVTCDSAEPKSIADLKRNGVNARPAKKGPGSIEHGIKKIQSYKVIIDIGCTNTIKEFSGYKLKEDKDGNIINKPVEINNHIIDAIRYAIESAGTSTGWGWKKEEHDDE